MVDGQATRACITPVATLTGKRITTIEGLADSEALHPVQQAFIDAQVPQCGWCMSGQIMTAAALLDQTPAPTPVQIDEAMARNLCRCGCYQRIREAVGAAATAIAPGLQAREVRS
jgi:isoquinoline 1-oxidoreductase alpha subunit